MATVRLHHPTKSANPAYSFGKKREERLNMVPGPATYDNVLHHTHVVSVGHCKSYMLLSCMHVPYVLGHNMTHVR